MKYDFEGYVSRSNVLCDDGRIICQDAFAEQNGARVPLVYQHQHNDLAGVIGFVDLENRPEGMWGRGSLNSTQNGKLAAAQLQHGDLDSMSIYANKLEEQGNRVLHGKIREVSLVLAGANPGAKIEQISIQHDGVEDYLDEAIIYSGSVLSHASDPEPAASSPSSSTPEPKSQEPTGEGFSVADIWDDMDDDEKEFVITALANYLQMPFDQVLPMFSEIGAPSDAQEVPQEGMAQIYNDMDDDEKKVAAYLLDVFAEQIKDSPDAQGNASQNAAPAPVGDNAAVAQSAIDYEGDFMYQNAFESSSVQQEPVVAHSSLNDVLSRARAAHASSLKDVFDEALAQGAFEDTNGNVIQHDGTNRTANLNYGIQDIEYLFPDAKTVANQPVDIQRDQTWVADFMNGTNKAPFNRIKSIAADVTADTARAKGYVTGKKKVESVVKALRRTTDPQTVYEKQKLDRDDMNDITDFDIVVWLKAKMSMLLREEVARAGLIGDGRQDDDEQKIQSVHIRPIYGDSDVYTIYSAVTDADLAYDDGLSDMAIRARKNYKGSGSPVMYATNDTITSLLLSRDKNGRRIYANEQELASAMRVARVVEVPVMENATRSANGATMAPLAIIVNPRDYTFGANKGGEEQFFDDFDIDFNQYKYLAETRTSGALTVPYGAIALEYDKAKYQFTAGKLVKIGG